VNSPHGWPAGENDAKKTMERSAVDLSWNTSGVAGGTPRVENLARYARKPPALLSASAPTIVATPVIPVQISAPSTSTGSGENTSSTVTTLLQEEASSTPTSTPASVSPTAPAVSHVVIAVVQIAGASSSNDFLKLYNPTSAAIDIGGWKLRKRANTGTESSLGEIDAGNSILPGEYFIWANSSGNFAASINANMARSYTLAARNSAAIVDSLGTVIDALAWGANLTNPFVEGASYPDDPAANQVLKRKFINGAVQDTDNNAADFEVQ